MILRPDQKALLARLKETRHAFRLQLAELADELHITPEWLSKIFNGHHPASYNIGLRLDDFLRRQGLNPTKIETSKGRVALRKIYARKSSAEVRRTEIRQAYARLLSRARNDPKRLTWIARKLQAHLAVSESWKSSSKRKR